MYSYSVVPMLIVLLVLSIISYSCGWVFTDVNLDHLRKIRSQDFDENEIPTSDDDEDMKQLKFSLIYPGTKWCGPGNVADNFDDLGTEWAADSCCREHDNCPDIIAAGETKHNLTNHAFYTRLNCACDEEFRSCLHNASSNVADQIGTIYFNALGTQCYREDYPITGCKRRGGWFNKKCLQYTYDKQGKRLTQWFDVPNY